MQCVRDTHCIRPSICSTQLSGRSRSAVCRRKSCIVRAARSSGGEEREQALKQQWQEAGPEDQQGPYEGGPYSGPYGNGQYYQQQYPGYQYGSPPQPSSGGVPWGWVIFGGIAAILVSKVVDFFSPSGGGPQAKMMNFMMKQAMKGAGGGGGNTPSGFPDFSQLGGAGMPGSFPGSGFPTAPSTSSSQQAASSPVVDTQARSVNQTAGSSTPSSPSEAASDSTRRGAKFEEMKEKSRRRRRDGPAASPSPAFTDVDQEEKAGTSTATGGAADEQDDSATMEMLEQFIQDPNMQQLLYQYLPEPMRNKETFEWMLKNPEYRAQLQSMIKAQGAQLTPEVYKQMQGIDSEQVTRQLAEHGMTPADVIKKIMSEPELATAFSKPQVQQAIMELQSNPMAMVKYQDDPDVMLVFDKMSQMFPQMGGGPEAAGSS